MLHFCIIYLQLFVSPGSGEGYTVSGHQGEFVFFFFFFSTILVSHVGTVLLLLAEMLIAQATVGGRHVLPLHTCKKSTQRHKQCGESLIKTLLCRAICGPQIQP